MARIGIFGGSFNPVHLGHMHLAEVAFSSLELSRLIFMPACIPPHKSAAELCPDIKRFEMCCLACEEHEGYEVSNFEITRSGKSYTYYTTEYFSEKYPEDELFLIVGSDMLMMFEKWYRFEDILKKVTLAVVSREKDDREKLLEKAGKLDKYGNIIVIDAPSYPLSSTQIREYIKNGRNYSCYLPEKVVQYIRLNNLYK